MLLYEDKNGKLVNGIIFFFDAGDEESANLIMGVISKSFESPTSIVWGYETISRNEAVSQLYPTKEEHLERGSLAIRLTLEDDPNLLKSCLDILEKKNPNPGVLFANFSKELLLDLALVN